MSDIRRSLVINQIKAMVRLLADRQIPFDMDLEDAALNELSMLDLESVHRALHELVYAPPARN